MSTLTITIETGDSDAMVTEGEFEVATVLRALADKVQGRTIEPGDSLPVRDTNGARVGAVVWAD